MEITLLLISKVIEIRLIFFFKTFTQYELFIIKNYVTFSTKLLKYLMKNIFISIINNCVEMEDDASPILISCIKLKAFDLFCKHTKNCI